MTQDLTIITMSSASLQAMFENLQKSIDKISQFANVNEHDETLSRKQAAALLKISLATLNKHTKEGTIKASRIGKRVLYQRSDLNNARKQIITFNN